MGQSSNKQSHPARANDWCLYKKDYMKTQRLIEGRRPCNNRGRDWSDGSTGPNAGSHQKLEGKEGFFSRPLKKRLIVGPWVSFSSQV